MPSAGPRSVLDQLLSGSASRQSSAPRAPRAGAFDAGALHRGVSGWLAVAGICVTALVLISLIIGGTVDPGTSKLLDGAGSVAVFGTTATFGATLMQRRVWAPLGRVTVFASALAACIVFLLILDSSAMSPTLGKVLVSAVVVSLGLGFCSLLLSHARAEDTQLTTSIMYAVVGVSVVFVLLALAGIFFPGSQASSPISPVSSVYSPTSLLTGRFAKAMAVCGVLSWAGIVLLPVLRRLHPAYRLAVAAQADLVASADAPGAGTGHLKHFAPAPASAPVGPPFLVPVAPAAPGAPASSPGLPFAVPVAADGGTPLPAPASPVSSYPGAGTPLPPPAPFSAPGAHLDGGPPLPPAALAAPSYPGAGVPMAPPSPEAHPDAGLPLAPPAPSAGRQDGAPPLPPASPAFDVLPDAGPPLPPVAHEDAGPPLAPVAPPTPSVGYATAGLPTTNAPLPVAPPAPSAGPPLPPSSPRPAWESAATGSSGWLPYENPEEQEELAPTISEEPAWRSPTAQELAAPPWLEAEPEPASAPAGAEVPERPPASESEHERRMRSDPVYADAYQRALAAHLG